MKHFRNFFRIICHPWFLLWLFPIALIIPNVALTFTESMPWSAAIANIAFPLGIYYVLIALSPKIGRSILWFLPVIFFAAFQIVLLFLYGQSIIGVDMLLNVVTTNSGEVAELLNSLILPMFVVIVLYVTPIVLAIVSIVKRRRVHHTTLHKCKKMGLIITLSGITMIILSYIIIPYYSIGASIFPVNVTYNLVAAVKRTIKANRYYETSKDFKYNATSTHDAKSKELYVMVIGETSRAENWQLFGYDRETTPRLSKATGLIGFSHALSESNTTHKSVPMLMSTLSAATIDSIYTRKGIISAFKEAGYHTAFLSMQRYNHSFIDYFGMEADTVDFIRERNPKDTMLYDEELIKEARRLIEHIDHNKMLIVLHTYGSHFNYRDRYPDSYSHFTPDDQYEADVKYRDRLINAYDNTIRYTDYLLGELISYLGTLPDTDCALIYASDHGEDIFDYGSGRFLHASPIPSYNQLHVPMILWLSNNYRQHYPEKWINAYENKDLNVSTSASMANTLLDIAGISTVYYDSIQALSHQSYQEPTRVYINDRNKAIPLQRSGIKKVDIEMLQKRNLINTTPR